MVESLLRYLPPLLLVVAAAMVASGNALGGDVGVVAIVPAALAALVELVSRARRRPARTRIASLLVVAAALGIIAVAWEVWGFHGIGDVNVDGLWRHSSGRR